LAAVSLPNALTSASYNADNEMTTFGTAALTYDANGNLTSDSANSYTWDARNHLSQISGPVTGSFIYDALGRRTSKTVGASVAQFLYDRLNPVQELSAAGTVSANLLTGLKLDEYFTRSDSSGTMAFLADALGSTVGLVNSVGALATSYTYEPFGNTSVSGTGNSNPYQFNGRENDGTGLYFYRARYYSPTYQRFIAQDPIDFRGGDTDLYAYVAENPVNLTDALGLLYYLYKVTLPPSDIYLALHFPDNSESLIQLPDSVGFYQIRNGCPSFFCSIPDDEFQQGLDNNNLAALTDPASALPGHSCGSPAIFY
jgi:RHS repeat-associated protein